jgi:Tol biopolymer transport system component
MNADGSGVTRLSPPGVTDYSPAWSPSKEHIAFVSYGQGVCVMKPAGSGRLLVRTRGGRHHEYQQQHSRGPAR